MMPALRQTIILLAGVCALAAPAVLAQETSDPASSAVTQVSDVAIEPITYRPFRRGITQTVELPAGLQNARRRLIAGQGLRTADLRALADAGDSLAQMRFAKMLGDMEDPSLVGSQIHYYAMAAYNGREGAVRPLLSLVRTHGASLAPSALRNAESALLAQASHGQADAMGQLAKFYMSGNPFGAKPAEGRELMAKIARSGDHQAALDLALAIIAEQSTSAQPAEAKLFLEIAAASPEPALRATALSLLSEKNL